MRWFDAIRTSVDEDLRPFSRYLSERGVCHRVIEQGGRQVLLLADQREALLVRRWFEEWRRGRLHPPAAGGAAAAFDWRRAPARARTLIARYPVVVALASLSVAGAWLVWSDGILAVRWLALEDARTAVAGQWWRFVSPAFLHFGIIHLAFNLLWLAELGRRIESSQSGARLLLVAMLAALSANLAQYWHVPGSTFGGMSGVVYGLLGYCWLAGRLRPTPLLQLPSGVVAFLLGWMLLCMTGIFSAIGVHVANAAHVGGFAAGLLLALLPPPSASSGADGRGAAI